MLFCKEIKSRKIAKYIQGYHYVLRKKVDFLCKMFREKKSVITLTTRMFFIKKFKIFIRMCTDCTHAHKAGPAHLHQQDKN